MKSDKNKYVIGIDGGGTKTIAVLADLKGRFLKRAKSGSSSPRNVGVKKATDNVAMAIKGVLKGNKNKKIASVFVGLPAVAEEYRFRVKEIEKLLKKKIPEQAESKIEIGSDQDVAFRSGTDEKDGIVIIAGTGCVVRGWKGKSDTHTNGWGWLADEGSGFFVGQKAFQSILKDLDGRASKTLLTKLLVREFNFKKPEDLINFVYLGNPTEIIPAFSVICDNANRKGDIVAREILVEAAKEMVLAISTVINKLNLENSTFPLVLVGSMFKSKTILHKVKRDIKNIAHRVKFIRPHAEPVTGAVKLAIERM